MILNRLLYVLFFPVLILSVVLGLILSTPIWILTGVHCATVLDELDNFHNSLLRGKDDNKNVPT